ncbi:MAG: methionine synthase [Deltaproteobacteria bacterium HGW-Deltaproteobacteria-15]|jgi:5-methyltetrahydrofolate--homocysteine methyltransferase|nr:MAG: methionine synthase [Deltaproteobacteria bacterium HGW-Deltaproteobacteria-15]
MSGELVRFISDLQEGEALRFVEESLAKGVDPKQLLDEAKEGMNIVGRRFSEGTYFIPDLMFSGEILKSVVKILQPHLKKGKEAERKGKVIVGTVAGDIHDIGKDLVVFMLDVNGFEVLDLGIDVPVQKFVDAVKASGSRVVGLSGFLTLAFQSMKDTIDEIQKAGLRDKVKIMIGGGQVDEQVRKFTGADAYGKDAMEAVSLANGWIGG